MAAFNGLEVVNPLFLKDYRGVVALNNMGVLLLERKAYQEAMETFQDAVSVMHWVSPAQARKHALLKQKNGGAASSYLSLSDIDNKLQKSVQRFAAATTSLPKDRDDACSSQPLVPVVNVECLDILSYSSSLFEGQRSIILNDESTATTTTKVHPIRIEGTDDFLLSSCFDQRDADLQSATILYNFGLSHKCLAYANDAGTANSNNDNQTRKSSCTLSTMQKQNYQRTALQLMELSHNILAPRYLDEKDAADGSISKDCSYKRTPILSAATLVLSCLWQTLQELDNRTALAECKKQRRCQEALIQLCHVLRREEASSWCYGQPSPHDECKPGSGSPAAAA